MVAGVYRLEPHRQRKPPLLDLSLPKSINHNSLPSRAKKAWRVPSTGSPGESAGHRPTPAQMETPGMEKRARLHPDVQVVAPPASFFGGAGELGDDELDMAVGGLERVWIPSDRTETRHQPVQA